MESMECLNKDAQKKKGKNDAFCASPSTDDQISTSVLDIMYESYGFSGDLIKTIDY